MALFRHQHKLLIDTPQHFHFVLLSTVSFYQQQLLIVILEQPEISTMAQTAPKLIFGSAGIAAFDGQTINEILALLEKHNVEKIDTANAYVSYPHPIILFGIV
jgi:hypothetical protein